MNPSILFYPSSGYRAQFYLRMLWPAEALARNGWNVRIKDPRQVDEWTPEKMLLDFLEADIIVTHQPRKNSDITMLEVCLERGKHLVVDSDDFAFDVNPSNPAYGAVGLEAVDGLWQDGIQLDRSAALKKHGNTMTIMNMASACTYTTSYLNGLYEPYVTHHNNWVLPNSLNLNQYKEWERRAPKDEIRIGWAGGASHFEDLNIIVKPLYEIFKKHDNVKLVMFGEAHPDITQLFEGKLEQHPWVDMETFYTKYHSLDVDINLCPLAENEFNKGKSPLKMLEAGVFKIPSVASEIPKGPYNSDTNMQDRVLVDDDGWYNAIEGLVTNKDLRRRVGEGIRRTTETVYNIEINWKYWAECYAEVFKKLVGTGV